MRFFLLLLLAMPLMAQDNIVWTSSWPQGWSECETGQFLTKKGECLPESRRTADNAKCPAEQYATAYGTCERYRTVQPHYGTADATIWDSGGSQSGPSLVSQGDTTLFIFDSSSVRPNTLYVYASSSANPLLTCKMPTQDTAADCKLADGVTLDQLMTAIFQSEQRAGEQWMADVDAANKRTQQCVNIAENLIGHPRAKSRKKKGGK